MKKISRILILGFGMALATRAMALALTCESRAAGNWSTNTTWLSTTCANGNPGVNDNVRISSHVVLLDVSTTVTSLTLSTANANGGLTINATRILTVNNQLILCQPNTNGIFSGLNINASTVNVTGLISFLGSNTTATRVSSITVTSGQLTADGGFLFQNSTAPSKVLLTTRAEGLIRMKGAFTAPPNSSSFTAVNGSFNYYDTVAQNVYMSTATGNAASFPSGGGYFNLYLNNSSASGAVLVSTLTSRVMRGDLRIQSGIFKNGGNAITGVAGKTFEVANGAEFEMSNSTGFPNAFGTVTLGATSTVRYKQTLNPLTISTHTATFGHLELIPAATATQNFSSGTFTIQGNLTIGNGTNAATVSANASSTTLIVNGNLNIAANSTFVAPSSNSVRVGGNWSNSGTYTSGRSTVTFTGTTPQLTGSTTFYSLTSTVAGQTITAQANSSVTVTGVLSLAGTVGNEINLRSSTPGTYWYLVNTGTSSLNFVDAQDSNASGGRTIRGFSGGVDSGHNVNWAFTDANRYWVSTANTIWNSLNNWAYVSGGSPGASVPASTHTATFDGADGSVGVSSVTAAISISTLTMTSGYSGSLNTQGWAVTVTSGIAQSGGTINLSTSLVTLQGDLTLSGGTFTNGFSTITLTGGKIQTLSTIPGMDPAHLVINKTAATNAFLGSDFSIDGNLTVTAGNLNTSGTDFDLNVTSNVLINGGTLLLNASDMSVDGTWVRTSGTFTAGTSTVTFTGTGLKPINSGLQTFNHVVFDGLNSTWTLTSNGLFTNGDITLRNGIVNTGVNINVTNRGHLYLEDGIFISNSSSMSVAGNWSNSGGTFTAVGSTVTLTHLTAVQLTGSTTFYSLASTVAGQTITAQAGSTIGVRGFLTLTGAGGNEINLRSSNPGTQWYVINTGTNVLTSVDVQDSNGFAGRTLRANNGGIDSLNNVNWAFNTTARYWAASSLALWNSTFSWAYASGGAGGAPPPTSTNTVVFDGASGSVGISSISAAINISTLTMTSGYSGSLNTQGFGITVTSAIVQSGGTINLSTSLVTLQGDLTLTGGTFTNGSSTITLTGGKIQTLSSVPGMEPAHLVINKTAATNAFLESDFVIDGNLTVTAGNLDTTGSDFDLTVTSNVLINGGTLLLNGSDMTVRGNWVRTSGTFTPNTSTVIFAGPGSNPINSGLVAFNHVVFNGSNSTWTLTTNGLFSNGNITMQDGILNTGANINISNDGNFTLNGGTFIANSSSMSVAGNWSNTATVFTAGGSTVTLTHPTALDLTGSTTFYSLVSNVAGQSITVEAGSTIGVTGLLSINGANGNLIDFRSSNPGTPWYLISLGTSALSFVDAQDSDASFGRFIRDFPGGADSGNNLNWLFSDANRYWVSAILGNWNNSANWSLISGGASGASVPTSTHTATFDGVNGSMGVSSVTAAMSISTITMTSGYSGAVNMQGWAVTVTSAIAQSGGTINLSSSLVTLQGDLTLSGGTFTNGFSTITLTGGKSQTLSSIPGMDPGHLVINKTVATTASLGSNLTLDGNLTVTGGNFDTSGSDFDLTVASNVLVNGGTLILNDSQMNVAGGWIRTSGTLTPNTSTVTFTGPGTEVINSGLQTFNHVVFDGSDSTWTLTTNGLFTNGNITVNNGILTTGVNINITNDGNFVLSGGTFNANSSSMSVAGNWSDIGTVFNAGGSTVTLTHPTAVALTGSTTFYSLASTVAGQIITAQAGSTVGVTGFLTLTGAGGNEIQLRSSNFGNQWYVINTGTNNLSAVDVQDSNGSFGRTLRAYNGGIDSLNNLNWAFTTSARYWASPVTTVWNSTFSWAYSSGGSGGASPPTSSHTVIFDGADGSVGISSVNTTINISTLTMTSGYSGSLNLGGAGITISSAIVQSGGTISFGTSAFTLQGDMDLSGGTYISAASTVTLSGNKSQTISDVPGTEPGHLIVNKTGGTTASLGSDFTLDGNLTVTGGNFDTTGSDYELTVASNVLINGGTLILNDSQMNVAGGWIRTSGTLTPNTSTVTFTGPGAEVINSGLQTFNHVVFDGANSTWTLTTNGLFTNGNITMSNGILDTGVNINITNEGNFVLNGGTFSANSSSMSVAGNWSSGGAVFNAEGSTVTLTHPTAVNLTGSTTFYSLASSVSDQTITVQAGSTVGVTGFLTLTGAGGNEIDLRSSDPGDWWYLISNGTATVTSVDVQDSNALVGRTIRAYPTGIDSGNNRNWAFTDADRYWTAESLALWSSSSSWSLASGGSGGASPPKSTNTVTLDGANGAVGISSVNVAVNISTLTVSAGYSGSLQFAGAGVIISDGLVQSGGTITLGTSAVTLQGDLNLSAGTFSANQSTITLTGANDQLLSAASSMNPTNLVVNKTGGTASLGTDLTLEANFTLTAGTITTSASNYILTVSSDIRMTGGSFYMNNSTVNLQRNWIYTGGSLNTGFSNLELSGGLAQSLNPGTTAFHHLTINKSAGVASLSSDLDLTGTYRQAAGTFQPGNRLITIDGSWTTEGGAFTATGSTVVFNGTGTKTLTGSTSFHVFRSTTSGATLLFDPSTTIAVTQILDLKNVTLRSTVDADQWEFNVSATSRTLQGVDVKDSDASLGVFLQSTGTNSGNNLNWDFGAPDAIVFTGATQSLYGGGITLSWNAPGDDGALGTLNNSTFTIQYTTSSTFALSSNWSPIAALPTAVYRIDFPTSSVTPGSAQSSDIIGLRSGETYYSRIWTKDDVGNYSSLSDGATTFATVLVLDITPPTATLNFGALTAGATVVHNTGVTFTNSGNAPARFTVTLTNPAVWTSTTGPATLDEFRLTGIFRDTLPTSNDFSITNDVLSAVAVSTASATDFALDTDGIAQKGISVPPGGSRTMWFRMEMPPVSTTDSEQVIQFNASSTQ